MGDEMFTEQRNIETVLRGACVGVIHEMEPNTRDVAIFSSMPASKQKIATSCVTGRSSWKDARTLLAKQLTGIGNLQ